MIACPDITWPIQVPFLIWISWFEKFATSTLKGWSGRITCIPWVMITFSFARDHIIGSNNIVPLRVQTTSTITWEWPRFCSISTHYRFSWRLPFNFLEQNGNAPCTQCRFHLYQGEPHIRSNFAGNTETHACWYPAKRSLARRTAIGSANPTLDELKRVGTRRTNLFNARSSPMIDLQRMLWKERSSI